MDFVIMRLLVLVAILAALAAVVGGWKWHGGSKPTGASASAIAGGWSWD